MEGTEEGASGGDGRGGQWRERKRVGGGPTPATHPPPAIPLE